MIPFVLLLACPRGLVGVEGGLAAERPAYVTVTGEWGGYTDRLVAAPTAQLRLGPSGAEFGLGATACASTRDERWILDGCARVYALELGWRRDHWSYGALSPAIGPAITYTLREIAPIGLGKRGRPDTFLRDAVTVALWMGLDTRVSPGSDTAPYLGVQVGYGFRIVE